MILRKWTKNDIKQIAEIELRCFPKSCWTEKMILDSFVNDNFYTALIEEDGKIIAYIGVITNSWDAEIAFIAVDLPYRRKGYATTLLNKIKQDFILEKKEKIFLEVRVSNLQAIALYQKNGFTVFSRRKKYYENNEDCLNMVCVL